MLYLYSTDKDEKVISPDDVHTKFADIEKYI